MRRLPLMRGGISKTKEVWLNSLCIVLNQGELEGFVFGKELSFMPLLSKLVSLDLT